MTGDEKLTAHMNVRLKDATMEQLDRYVAIRNRQLAAVTTEATRFTRAHAVREIASKVLEALYGASTDRTVAEVFQDVLEREEEPPLLRLARA